MPVPSSIKGLVLIPVLAVTLLVGCGGSGTKQATVEGDLVMVGGPAPGGPRPVSGTLMVVGDKEVTQIHVPASGRFSFEIAPGSYEISGSNGIPCGTEAISLTNGQSKSLTFICSVR